MSMTLKVVDGDVLVSSSSGRPITIKDNAKLKQDIKEFFEVYVLPNGFGAGIEELVGIVQFDRSAFVTVAQQNIAEGLRRFIALQGENASIPRPNSELVYSFNNLIVESDTTDPTKFYFTVNILTKAGEPFQYSQTIG